MYKDYNKHPVIDNISETSNVNDKNQIKINEEEILDINNEVILKRKEEKRKLSEKLENDESFRKQYIKEKTEADVPSMGILKNLKLINNQKVRYEDDDMQSNHTISREDTTHDLSLKNEDELWNLLLDNQIMLPDDAIDKTFTKFNDLSNNQEQYQQVSTDDDEILKLIKETQKSREEQYHNNKVKTEAGPTKQENVKNCNIKNKKNNDSIIRILNVQTLNINIYK